MSAVEGKVNLFVVGAMKAGTTSFVDMLSQHPDIYVPPIKEPNYFTEKLPKKLYEPSRFFNLDDYFKNKFPAPLHIAKIIKKKHYKKLYSKAQREKYWVDASTAYLHAPGVAERICAYNPNARIIILVRDPIKRSYSHYKMDVGLGRTLVPFERSIQKDIAAYKTGSLPWFSYMAMSFYRKSLMEYKEYFKEILIVDFDTLVNDQNACLARVFLFLEIPSKQLVSYSKRNISKELRFQKLFYALRKIGLKDYFSKVFSDSFKQKLFARVSKKTNKKIKLSVEVRKELEIIFEKESKV